MELPAARTRRGFSGTDPAALQCPKVSLPRYWNRVLWSRLFLTLLHAEEDPLRRCDIAGLTRTLTDFLSTHREQLAGIYKKLIVALSHVKK